MACRIGLRHHAAEALAEGGFEYGAGGEADRFAPHLTAEGENAFIVPRPHVAEAHQEFRGDECRGAGPVCLQTKDMRGIETSLYRGRYYTKASEAKRLCIVERESEGHYDVVSPSGSYYGAYQVSRAGGARPPPGAG